MAGRVRILKDGEVLFRTGEKADSMYIVRTGSLKVYFLKGNEEVQLAQLGDGAVVGEMAFFDQKPRSAHVKALAQTEITEITREDFDKLLTQIPKWLVTMLQSMSGRLRTTNEKLAQLEKRHQITTAGGFDLPFMLILRSLRVLQLLALQLGQKEGNVVWTDYERTLEWWIQITGWPRDYFSRFVDELQKQGLVQKRLDGVMRLLLTGRGRMLTFTNFLGELQSRMAAGGAESFNPLCVEVLEVVASEAADSGYEVYNVSLLQLSRPQGYVALDTQRRLAIAENLVKWLQIRHTKSDVDFLMRVVPKDLKVQVAHLRLLQSLLDAGLDRFE
ncbi:MAG: hypothetical protein RIR26_2757 [Pseudomonadota bacterium]